MPTIPLSARMRRCSAVAFVLTLGLALSASAGPPSATDQQNIGLTSLQTRLGSGAPTGAGVTATQVEASSGTASQYFIDTNLSDFSGKTITDATGGGTVSNHATNVAQNFYGNSGVASGVSTVKVYQADNWLGSGFLNTRTPLAPQVETSKIQNDSWIANFVNYIGQPDVAKATDVLRRIDYVVDRDGTVVVAGVDNGYYAAMPQVLAQAYNVISVGRSDGGSSLGPSTIDGTGRSIPDIVAPATNTSTSTAWVSGAAALLLQTGAGMGNSATQQPETIKAVLMAGAIKSPFDLDGNTPNTLDNWSHAQAQPLDPRYGAGQLNIDNSHFIMASGQQSASNLANVGTAGWDYAQIQSSGARDYYFQIPQNYVAYSFSSIAAWNRGIAFTAGLGSNPATFTPSLAHVNLQLYNANGFAHSGLVDQSISAVDNVQHVFDRFLQSGQYAMSVTSDATTDFALAWTTKLVLRGDANGDGVVDGADYTIWADNFGKTSVLFNKGDFNGDGVVNGADYTLWADNFGSASAYAASLPVPEPSALLLAAAGGLALSAYLWRRRQRRQAG